MKNGVPNDPTRRHAVANDLGHDLSFEVVSGCECCQLSSNAFFPFRLLFSEFLLQLGFLRQVCCMMLGQFEIIQLISKIAQAA